MFSQIIADLRATMGNPITSVLSNRGFHSLLCYRISHFLYNHKIPLIPLILTRIIQILYGIDIDYRAKVGGGCCIVHGIGLVVGHGVVIGNNSKIYHGVTIGIAECTHKEDGFATIGDNVLIGAGAKILGKIKIGNHVKIGANAVVTKNIPDFAVAIGIPATYEEQSVRLVK